MLSIMRFFMLGGLCLIPLALGFSGPAALPRSVITSSLSLAERKRLSPFSHEVGNSNVMPATFLFSEASSSSSENEDNSSLKIVRNPITILGSLWGTGSVLYILLTAFKHTLPHALEPIRHVQGLGGAVVFSPLQWSIYAATVVIFALGQGNRCLQRLFAPLVVKRAFNLDYSKSRTVNFVLAPLYVMGLLHATKSRLIKSSNLIFGTAALQIALQSGMIISGGASSPLLSILNAGFAAGFGWGVVSLAWLYVSSIVSGKTPTYDAGFPE